MGKYDEVIEELKRDHPWVPGAMFMRHPELRSLLIECLEKAGEEDRKKVWTKPVITVYPPAPGIPKPGEDDDRG